MAFKLSKEESKQRVDLIARLQDAAEEVETAVSQFNSILEEERGNVEEKLAAYNSVLAEAKEFAEGVSTRAEEEISEKSDGWQESDRGRAAQEWQEEWANLCLDEAEIDWPDELSWDEPEHATDLESVTEDVAEAA